VRRHALGRGLVLGDYPAVLPYPVRPHHDRATRALDPLIKIQMLYR
jgi:hypothetical protein